MLSHISDEVDCVIEFGSGIGDNIASIASIASIAASNLGKGISYIACEPSESGRRATELIFSAIPYAEVEVRHFDYTTPDLSFLKQYKLVVAFTCHSIEQIPILGGTFYHNILESPVFKCVHLEPIGWQRYDNLVKEVRAQHNSAELWKRHKENYCYVLDEGHMATNAASWAAAGSYNTDLLRVIASHAQERTINITAIKYDVIGHNPFNPSTLLSWSRQHTHHRNV